MNPNELELGTSQNSNPQPTQTAAISRPAVRRAACFLGIGFIFVLCSWYSFFSLQPKIGPKIAASAHRRASGQVVGRSSKQAPNVTQRQGINPDARKLLQEMTAAYAALTSYSDTTEIQEIGMDKPLRQGSRHQRSQIQFARPAKIAITTLSEDDTPHNGKSSLPSDISHSNSESIIEKVTSDEAGTATWSVSDGATFYSVKAAQSGRYLKQPLETAEFGSQALMQQQPAGSLFTAMLTGVDTLAAPWGRPPLALYKASPTEINGEKVDIVVARFDNKYSPGEPETIAYEMSQRDHLLRRLVISRFVEGKRLITVETHKDVKINLALPTSTFAFSPPKGWQAVERWTPPTWDKRLIAGASPLPFETTDLEGKPLSLKQYQGKAVLLMFWASWCGSCKRELPHVQQASEAYQEKGFEVVGVSLDRKQDDLVAFLKKNPLSWHNSYDGQSWKGELVQLYGVRSIPFSLLIGRDGKIAAVNPQRLQLMSEVRRSLDLAPKTMAKKL